MGKHITMQRPAYFFILACSTKKHTCPPKPVFFKTLTPPKKIYQRLRSPSIARGLIKNKTLFQQKYIQYYKLL